MPQDRRDGEVVGGVGDGSIDVRLGGEVDDLVDPQTVLNEVGANEPGAAGYK